MKTRKTYTTIILCAGRGKRLIPITDHIPKCLLPIDSKPIIETLVENLKQAGLRKIILVIGHLGEKLKNYLSQRDIGKDLTYVEQKERKGTAHAVLQALHLVDSDLILISGDTLFPTSHIRSLIYFYETTPCDAVISLKKISKEQIASMSWVKLDNENNVLDVIEKPDASEVTSNSGGNLFHVYSRGLISHFKNPVLSQRHEYEITTCIQNMIRDGKDIKGFWGEQYPTLNNHLDLVKYNFRYLYPYIGQD